MAVSGDAAMREFLNCLEKVLLSGFTAFLGVSIYVLMLAGLTMNFAPNRTFFHY